MLYFTRTAVAQALDYLIHGNSGGPLNRDQFLWELQNSVQFGCCLKIAAAHPDIFPSVCEAPYMRRQVTNLQNTITEDGRPYLMPAGLSSESSGDPICIDLPRWWLFPSATLSD